MVIPIPDSIILEVFLELKLDLKFDFDEEFWVCNFKGKTIKAESFEILEKELYNLLKKEGLKGKVKVKIVYNWKNLPQWLWQYQSYYFEREWVFEL